MSLEFFIYPLLIGAIAFHISSAIFAIIHSKKGNHIAHICLWIGWLLCLGIFIINFILAQAPPFGNMYQVMSFMPLVIAPIYEYTRIIQKQAWLLPFFASTAAIALVGTCFMPMQAQWSQMPALQSPWFVPHVASYILSYALATIGTLLLLINFLKEPHRDSAKRYHRSAYMILTLAFPFMTFGLWSGAIWADEVWGGYWSWDIKEVWSLITWILYISYFHLHRLKQGKKYQPAVAFTAYTALIITFLVVNLMPKISSMHSYAQ